MAFLGIGQLGHQMDIWFTFVPLGLSPVYSRVTILHDDGYQLLTLDKIQNVSAYLKSHVFAHLFHTNPCAFTGKKDKGGLYNIQFVVHHKKSIILSQKTLWTCQKAVMYHLHHCFLVVHTAKSVDFKTTVHILPLNKAVIPLFLGRH
jgi:hypothetical protein